MATRGPQINLRYESQAQVDRFKKAARMRRWSLNTFVLVGADRLAVETLRGRDEEAEDEAAYQERLGHVLGFDEEEESNFNDPPEPSEHEKRNSRG